MRGAVLYGRRDVSPCCQTRVTALSRGDVTLDEGGQGRGLAVPGLSAPIDALRHRS